MVRLIRHPAWTGIVLPLVLAIGATFSPDAVRGLLLVAGTIAATWTFYLTEYAGKQLKKTSMAALVFAVAALVVYFGGHVLDARAKSSSTNEKLKALAGRQDQDTKPRTISPEAPTTTPRKEAKATEKVSSGAPKTSPTKPQAAGPITVGAVNAGPCGVVQVGGSGNQATGGNCAPLERHLNAEQIARLDSVVASLPDSIANCLFIETVNDGESTTFTGEITKVFSVRNKVQNDKSSIIRLVDPTPDLRGVYVIVHDQDSPNFGSAQKIANALAAATLTHFTSAKDLGPSDVKIVVQRIEATQASSK